MPASLIASLIASLSTAPAGLSAQELACDLPTALTRIVRSIELGDREHAMKAEAGGKWWLLFQSSNLLTHCFQLPVPATGWVTVA
jgi:hypothetical protein